MQGQRVQRFGSRLKDLCQRDLGHMTEEFGEACDIEPKRVEFCTVRELGTGFGMA